jgi:hypothetical protein
MATVSIALNVVVVSCVAVPLVWWNSGTEVD